MYSKRYLMLLSAVCRVSYFFGSNHMMFDMEREILYTKKWGCFKAFVTWLMLMQYVIIYIPYQLAKTWSHGNFLEFNFIMVMWLCALLGCIVLANFVLQPEEMCTFFNLYLVFVRNFGSKFI